MSKTIACREKGDIKNMSKKDVIIGNILCIPMLAGLIIGDLYLVLTLEDTTFVNMMTLSIIIVLTFIPIAFICMFLQAINEEYKKNKDNQTSKVRMCEKTYTEWLDAQDDYGLCSPPMDAQLGLDYLFDYLDIPPANMSMPSEQCNTEIVYEILDRYSGRFRKEWKAYKRLNDERRKNK